jgi:hypothetical protein
LRIGRHKVEKQASVVMVLQPPIASRIDLGYTREGITQRNAIINISSSGDEEE